MNQNRRLALQGFLGAGLVWLGNASPAAAQDSKMDQGTVQYQAQPKDGHQCSQCQHFVAPNACNLVAGNIAPSGWCLLFAAKDS